jgi:hypothetical protein
MYLGIHFEFTRGYYTERSRPVARDVTLHWRAAFAEQDGLVYQCVHIYTITF